MSDESAVDVGRSQRKDGSWPKPGDEGFVHPDGTPQSVRQLQDNQRAAADRAAAGSTVHGAPGPGGVQPASAAVEPSEAVKARAEQTAWVHDAHADLAEQAADEATSGRHEAASTPSSAKTADSSKTS